MTFFCTVSCVRNQCGGRLLHDFTKYNNADTSLRKVKTVYQDYMLIATFNEYQKEAYLACCSTFKLLGQSEPIINPLTNNKIFTAIFKG